MMIVDTSVWVDYFAGRATRETEFLQAGLGSEMVAIGDLILVEILQGFSREADFQSAKSRLSALPVFPMLGVNRAVRCAGYYRWLRKRGITVRKTIDTIIAGYCIENGHSLLYADRDFDPFVEHLGLKSAV